MPRYNSGETYFWSNRLLESGKFDDYCPNGLQVEGRALVRKMIGGVSACQRLLEAAVEEGADAVLVHHGYFWKGEDARVVGIKRRRLRSLLLNDVNTDRRPDERNPLHRAANRLPSLMDSAAATNVTN